MRTTPLLLVVLLAGTSPLAQEAASASAVVTKPTVLVLDLEAVGASRDDAHFVTAEIAKTFASAGTVEVLTATDLRRLAALESDKQAAGCEQSSCLAELANAMGAQYVVFGSIGRIDRDYVLEMSLFEAANARNAGRRDARAASLSALHDQVAREVHALAGPLLPAWVEPEKGGSALVITGGVVAGVGAAVALIGGAAAGVAAPTVLDPKAPAESRNQMKALGAASTVGAGLGGTALVVGLAICAAAMVME